MNCSLCNDTGYINNVFIIGDLSQAEARIVGECLKRVGYPSLHNLYKKGDFDIHTWAAAPIFNCSEKDVTKYQRSVGKISNHSGNYGAGPNVLINRALKDGIKGIDYKFSKHILEKRHEQMPGLKHWWKDVENKLRKTRTLNTCFGRRRLFFDRLNQTTFRDAYSYEPQSTCGDCCNVIFRKLWQKFNSNLFTKMFPIQYKPEALIQVHDEVVVRCPNIPELVDWVIKEFKEAANIPLYICKDEPLIIPIDLEIGVNWKDTKEIE